MQILVMSDLAVTADKVMECVREHESRWMDRIYAHGLNKLVDSHYEKYNKEYVVAKDKEHALLELAAAALFALCQMQHDK